MNIKNVSKIIVMVLTIILFTSGCFQSAITQEPTEIIEDSTEAETPIVIETEKPIENTDEPTDETTDETTDQTTDNNTNIVPQSTESKLVDMYMEGMKQEEEFKLVYNENFRVLTYMPSVYLVETEIFQGREFIKAYTNDSKVAAVILYAIDGTGEEQIQEIQELTDSYFADQEYILESKNMLGDDILGGLEIIYINADAPLDNDEEMKLASLQSGLARIKSIDSKTYVLAMYGPAEFIAGQSSRFEKILEEIQVY